MSAVTIVGLIGLDFLIGSRVTAVGLVVITAGSRAGSVAVG